jgi:3-hydroxybutyrate dehydrogenase
VDAMTNAVSRLYPKNRYFVANMSDKIMAYGFQNLPLCISDRVVSAIESQIIPFEIVPYIKYFVMIPSFVSILSLVAMLSLNCYIDCKL